MNNNWFLKKIDEITAEYKGVQQKIEISKDLDFNVRYFKNQLGGSFDIKYRNCTVGEKKFVFVMVDGMCDSLLITEQIMNPIINADFQGVENAKLIYDAADRVSASIDKSITNDLDKAIAELISGNLVMFCEGSQFAVLFGVQNFPKRAPVEPNTEMQERGSREGFVESFKDNITMLRRRVRNPVFKIETVEVGATSKTRACVCYMSDRVNNNTLERVLDNLKKAEVDTVLGAGYLQSFLDAKHPSIFSGVGFTERPDVVTAKMAEGKICIIVDGTPNAIIVPYLFIEHFHSLDDYLKRPYYATFIRALKFVSFLFSVFLPGLYVAICTFHQEIIPESMIFGITGQESRTPFPMMIEALFIHLVYEIVREAGLRMPKTVGHAISIVGALVIGESAVTAGIVSAPMIIVVGLTAVSSFVVSTLYEPVAVLRFAFIIIGGLSGLYGIMLSFAVVLINASAINPYGIPFTSPMSPTKIGAWRDFILRTDWKKMGKKQMLIDKMEK
ncbi:MAG: spore germination protein [Clostridia bacterium]|nr:spore germination protein [Clostridia bacterium]